MAHDDTRFDAIFCAAIAIEIDATGARPVSSAVHQSADFAAQAAPTATTGVLEIVETAVIKDGTGRFAGASGSYVYEC